MCSNKTMTRTVVMRQASWYALICTLFCTAVFTLVSVRIQANANKRIDYMLSDELDEFAGIYEKQGMPGLIEEFDRETEATGAKDLFCRFLSPDGKVLLSSDLSFWKGIDQELATVPLPEHHRKVYSTLYPKSSPFNARLAASRIADTGILQMGINLRRENQSNRHTQQILITGSLFMILLSTISGLLSTRRAMAGVRRVTQAVTGIRRDSLHQAVPLCHEGREIDELANAFNLMLNRIEALVRELKEVSDNVAHDLRSPITRMRGAAETTLTGPQDLDAYREMGLTVLEESDRLSGMINTMLEIAQSESGVLKIEKAEIDLTDLLKSAADLFLPVAEEKQIDLTTDLPNEPMIVSGDKTRLQRVIANLFDNALKYTPTGKSICIRCKQTDLNRVQVEIQDTGIGIKPDELTRIFERFYRGEKSRSTEGNGLGLSLARSLIQAHGGRITAESVPDKGSTFRITLPLA
ncbi:sensor histidine kinase [Tichowtungia aerotolerans]|uniref:histidine kinase n=1 Tax=Tichowtungia aerotolerans TaxID=2697043 RepID=A0A6P1M4S8_9BACT|nr:ATP-binding protein [Tichowtungia aerotolerans]QHI69590.1 HAMP domain-containing protein [Tichowtungia aerotolerans]